MSQRWYRRLQSITPSLASLAPLASMGGTRVANSFDAPHTQRCHDKVASQRTPLIFRGVRGPARSLHLEEAWKTT